MAKATTADSAQKSDKPAKAAKPGKAGASRQAELLRAHRQYFRDVRAEMKRVVWPNRPEVINSSVVVVITLVFFIVFIALDRPRRAVDRHHARLRSGSAASRMAKKWYVIHTYSGYENKVKTNLEHRIQSMGMDDKIFNVVIPKRDRHRLKERRPQGHVREEGLPRLHPRADGTRRRLVVRRAQHAGRHRVRRLAGQAGPALARRGRGASRQRHRGGVKPSTSTDFVEGMSGQGHLGSVRRLRRHDLRGQPGRRARSRSWSRSSAGRPRSSSASTRWRSSRTGSIRRVPRRGSDAPPELLAAAWCGIDTNTVGRTSGRRPRGTLRTTWPRRSSASSSCRSRAVRPTRRRRSVRRSVSTRSTSCSSARRSTPRRRTRWAPSSRSRSPSTRTAASTSSSRRRRRPCCSSRPPASTRARATPNRDKVAHGHPATRSAQIAETKMPDLNANDVDAAMKIIAGTARSMGFEVVD